ncbi:MULTISPECIES: TetR/AcrR family transcriptional regulator [Novosphingobium]|uniref:TetR/AcrR family transcriptional regulator n=1 Tax=Novosphingobium TaxID=165696 RepID=UPI001CD5A44F|nr:TetR/AcrR family transcriptional regulator [Novosphingobium percolationis]MCH7629512.1 TetR/AcrR family transcriptional regulator [Pseudomonadota bacterium]
MTKDAKTADRGLATTVRAPQQGRSKASYERMLAAAEELLASRGSDEFTLNEVSKTGKVSIGSIYCRFDSKDSLIHAVQFRVLERVNEEMLAQIAAARENAQGLPELVRLLVDAVAETLRKHAALMRPLMLRASSDPVIAQTGKQFYAESADAFCTAILAHRDEIRQEDPVRATDSAFRILYAPFARHLGFGSAIEAAWEGDWVVLKEDISRMIAAFLLSPSR